MNVPRLPIVAALAASILDLAGCRGGTQALPPAGPPSIVMTGIRPSVPWAGKIKHVVIIYQENRTLDNMFNGYPGADTQSWGLDHNGNRVNLAQISETAPYDISHKHSAWLTEYDNGKLDGWDLVRSTACHVPGTCPPVDRRAYGIVPLTESQPYWDMAKEWTLADRMFQTNEGPSFPSHQYIISGTSTVANGSNWQASQNPLTPARVNTGGCDSPPGSRVTLIDSAGRENREMYPCFDRLTLMDLLDAKHLKWHYYVFSMKPGFWIAPDAIKHIRQEKHYRTEVLAPSSRVLSDVLNGDLESVVWVTPDADDSDHAHVADGSGPSWVASVVNAVGLSSYWKDSVILLTWDDWGGWFDHVKPPRYNTYELSFRVPLLVISPYAKQGYVSHQQHEMGSLLKFIEETYGLGSLGTTDVRSDDLADFFNFNQKPRKFIPIHAPIGPMRFVNKPPSNKVPDDDF